MWRVALASAESKAAPKRSAARNSPTVRERPEKDCFCDVEVLCGWRSALGMWRVALASADSKAAPKRSEARNSPTVRERPEKDCFCDVGFVCFCWLWWWCVFNLLLFGRYCLFCGQMLIGWVWVLFHRSGLLRWLSCFVWFVSIGRGLLVVR